MSYAENSNGSARPRKEPPSIGGRLPPHDLEAEAAVLSAIILTESSSRTDRRVLAEVAGFLRPEHFYAPAHQAMFAAILALVAESKPIDSVTVATWLRDREQLAGVGGPAYIAQVVDATPAISNAVEHAKTVAVKARRRAAIAEMQLLTAEGYGDVGDEAMWLESVETRLLLATGTSAREVVTIRDALTRAWTKANAALNGGPPEGGRTGLADLDAILGPLSPAKVTTIGGYWGEGKSALGLQIAIATAGEKREDTPSAALVISTEMSDEDLAQRALFMRARVDSSKLRAHRQKEITPLEWRELQEGVEYVGRLPLYIDDREATTPALIRASVRHHKAVAARAGQKLRVVVVDYLQLIDGRAGLPKSATRENEIANVARAMKQIANGEGVHVVALAQLNDDANKRPKDERRPTSRDFRESKAIPMNSDIVILIYNPIARERARQALRASQPVKSAKPEEVELIVDKYRGGRTGTANAIWFPSVTLFGDAQP